MTPSPLINYWNAHKEVIPSTFRLKNYTYKNLKTLYKGNG